MPKKKKTKTPASPHSIIPPKTVSAELLAKAYRLVRKSGSPVGKSKAAIMSLDDIVGFSQTPEGRAQTIAHIQRHGGPLYETDPKYPDLLVEVSPDGTRRLGRLVNRKFIECIIPAVKEPASTDKTALPADHPPMSSDNLGKLAHGLAKSKSRVLSAKLTKKITRGFYTA